MKNHYTALFISLTLLTSAGCSMIQHPDQTAGSYIDDVSISNSIRAKYLANNMVNGYAIKVETLRGVVQLSGFADSMSEKITAERLANEVNGVRQIHNDIIVKP